VTVSTGEAPTADDKTHAGKRLSRALDKAGSLLLERSLYAGQPGQRELFLLICRVRYQDFHRIRHEMLEPIWEATANAQTRTTTHPVVSRSLPCYADDLAVPAVSRPNVDALLQDPENQHFEVKGSAFAPLHEWLTKRQKLKEIPTFPDDGVLRAITALLNSGGGTLVIGALEEKDYRHDKALARIGKLPAVGRYRMLGLVDPTYRQQGWDGWERRLRTLIRKRIDPAPGVLVETRPVKVRGKTLCVVTVDRPDPNDSFFLNGRYCVRQGTESLILEGQDAERHRRQMKRASQSA
jgi:hypothetical protein